MKVLMILLMCIASVSCGTATMIEATGSGDYQVIYNGQDYRIEQTYDKEYSGGFSGFVLGEAFGPAKVLFRPYYKVMAKNNNSRQKKIRVDLVYLCKARGTLKAKRQNYLYVKPEEYGSEIRSRDIFWDHNHCKFRPISTKIKT